MNKKKFDTGLIGRIADKGKKLNSEDKIETNYNTSKDLSISSDIDSKKNTNIEIDNSNDTNLSTNTKIKKKYPKKQEKEKLQRAYYFEKELLKEFENFCKKNKADKSEVISFALREFLDTYE